MKPSARLALWLVDQAMPIAPAVLRKRLTRRSAACMVAAWALRTLCPGLSFGAIAHVTGRTHHTTALNAFTRVEALRAEDAAFEAESSALIATARVSVGELIAGINGEYKPRPTAEELQSIMTDVRRATTRLEKELNRLQAYLIAAQEVGQ